ncbi:MAG: hypothetical protein LBQ24_03845 [Candidatus Peribacteria bacterium]|jgi:GTP1/Obg family GTP-binding protein|nr:hypothetical protein [Candidatus Peribacteria bacterium]
MRDILKAQNEAKFLIELLLSQNIEIYTIYQTFIDFQREVKESLEFFQTCHPNYKELQDFATESFENQQRLADTHLENAKTLLEEASEYINFNRRLLANKKEKMELLNRLYSILDPNFNTENLFKVLENIWTFNGKIEEIIKLFKDFKIDNYDLFLDKDTLSKILNYPDLYNFK